MKEKTSLTYLMLITCIMTMILIIVLVTNLSPTLNPSYLAR